MFVDDPIAGCYEIRLVRGGPPVAVKLWHGPPHDPVTGEEMDRSWRWQVVDATGEMVDLDRVWPACADSAIHHREFERQQREIARLTAAGSTDARLTPRRRTDWDTAPPPSF